LAHLHKAIALGLMHLLEQLCAVHLVNANDCEGSFGNQCSV
jgi:hypothetical protein